MAEPKHYCAQCGKKMYYDRFLSIKSKGISSWWCFNCELVEVFMVHKVKNAVNTARRFVFYGKLGHNPKQ